MTDLLPRLSVAALSGGDGPDAPCAARALWLEIGFGSGEHLVHQACNNPDVALIGAEPFLNGVGSLLDTIDKLSLANIRVYCGDALELIERSADACLDRVFLLFPDPWPKNRHWKRRFINMWTLDALARVLKDEAILRVATDHLLYQRHVLTVLPEHPSFEWVVGGVGDWRTLWNDAIETRYAAKARREGRKPLYLTFRRKKRGLSPV